MTGIVDSIHLRPQKGKPTISVPQVEAIAGQGLKGDYSFSKDGLPIQPKSQLTLIESESVHAMNQDMGIKMEFHQPRRNIVTKGVALNSLVGKEFYIGTVKAKGVVLCHPCAHLESLTGFQVLKGLNQRGGLRAEILESGVIHAGDSIIVSNV